MHMDSQPLVSIGIPTRNRIKYLKEALGSAINQTYQNIEIIISNNNSNDNTHEYLESIQDSRIKVFHQISPLDMIDNWNFCLRSAKGKYFLLLSDDDLLEKNCISELLKKFSPEVAFVFSHYSIIDEYGSMIKVVKNKIGMTSPKKRLELYFQNKCKIIPSCTLYRFQDIEKHGYDKKFKLAADTGLWMSILWLYPYSICISSNSCSYRIHSKSQTSVSQITLWMDSIIRLVSYCSKMGNGYYENILIRFNSYFYLIKTYIYLLILPIKNYFLRYFKS